jgi:hypothetical protein
MDKENFADQMSDRSDEELYEIAYFGSEDGFVSQAVQAAKQELDQRGLDNDKLEQLTKSAETKRKQQKELAEKHLSWPARIAFFILPLGLIPIVILIVIAASLESRGYTRKSSEAYKWMCTGFIVWLFFAFVFVALNLAFSHR